MDAERETTPSGTEPGTIAGVDRCPLSREPRPSPSTSRRRRPAHRVCRLVAALLDHVGRRSRWKEKLVISPPLRTGR